MCVKCVRVVLGCIRKPHEYDYEMKTNYYWRGTNEKGVGVIIYIYKYIYIYIYTYKCVYIVKCVQ